MKLPGGIQTNFMPMLFVKFLGGSSFLSGSVIWFRIAFFGLRIHRETDP